MNKSYLKQMLTYFSKVYHLGEKINTLKDKRVKSSVKILTITFVVLFGFMLQIRSFNRLDYWLKKGKSKKVLPKKTKMPRIDAVRRCLSDFDLDGLKEIHKHIIKTTVKNRENSKGQFNVPFGRYKNPSFFDESQLREISRLLNLKNKNGEFKVKILNKSFYELEEYIDANTFVYCDPPYRPVTAGGFTSYNKSNFNDEAQILLRDFSKILHKKGAKVMLSNSDPKNLDEKDNFFDDLYSEFNIKRVYAKRNINSVGSKRGKISELLIKNYKDEVKMEVASTKEESEFKGCQ